MTTVGLNLKAVPVISAPVSLRSDATVRRADAENQGSLISRNVMENKGNFPACVYIKANVKRVCICGADPSSAARAGLSHGTQRGFMASRPPLQQDARIQTCILHSYPDDAKTQEVEWDLRRTGGRNWLGGSHFAPVCLHTRTLVQVGERREGGWNDNFCMHVCDAEREGWSENTSTKREETGRERGWLTHFVFTVWPFPISRCQRGPNPNARGFLLTSSYVIRTSEWLIFPWDDTRVSYESAWRLSVTSGWCKSISWEPPGVIRGSDTLYFEGTHINVNLLKRVMSKNTVDRRELHPRRLTETGPIRLEMKMKLKAFLKKKRKKK